MEVSSLRPFYEQLRGEVQGGELDEMKRQESDTYHSYLLRLWQECRETECLWRASLESVQTAELCNFASLAELVAFLHHQTESASEVKEQETE